MFVLLNETAIQSSCSDWFWAVRAFLFPFLFPFPFPFPFTFPFASGFLGALCCRCVEVGMASTRWRNATRSRFTGRIRLGPTETLQYLDYNLLSMYGISPRASLCSGAAWRGATFSCAILSVMHVWRVQRVSFGYSVSALTCRPLVFKHSVREKNVYALRSLARDRARVGFYFRRRFLFFMIIIIII